jgi:hypothetical protein
LADYVRDTRHEPGCQQFEYFRSLEFPENALLLERWSGPEIYDIHFLNRSLQRLYGGPGTPSPATRLPAERRYGQAGLEFYQHAFFALVGGVWQPEEASQRMVTIRWP